MLVFVAWKFGLIIYHTCSQDLPNQPRSMQSVSYVYICVYIMQEVVGDTAVSSARLDVDPSSPSLPPARPPPR